MHDCQLIVWILDYERTERDEVENNGIRGTAGDPVSQRILKDRKYTFVVDNDAGELQVGAHGAMLAF